MEFHDNFAWGRRSRGAATPLRLLNLGGAANPYHAARTRRVSAAGLLGTPYLKVLLGAQGKLHHAFEQLVHGQASEIVHDQLLGVEPHEVAKLQRLAA